MSIPSRTKVAARKLIHPGAETFFANVLAGSGAAVVKKTRVNNFYWGMTELGLYQRWVSSWDSRSEDNAGTGAVLYGHKGLNGTIVAGPSWDADGFVLNGSSQYIEFDNPLPRPSLNNYSIVSVIDSDVSVSRTICGSDNGEPNRGPILYAGGSPIQGTNASRFFHDITSAGTSVTQIPASPGAGRITNTGANTGLMQCVSAGVTGTIVSMDHDATRVSSALSFFNPWNNNAKWRIGARVSGSSFFLGRIPFIMILDTGITQNQHLAIRQLLKDTIGAGLNIT
jgi:hypothetical protein